jgi:ribosomal protein L11 methyltransferase
MNRRSKAVRPAWCWRRWISAGAQDLWIGRLQGAGHSSWAFTERPARSRVLLEVYLPSRAGTAALRGSWGGRVRTLDARIWTTPRPTPPTRIGSRLEIIHHAPRRRKGPAPACPSLHIPHGVAFGSGEHATTHLLLRALAAADGWTGRTVLDLGTGSGVLALAARLLGARRVVATDFDPEAVRTARQNEALNFSTPLVRWSCADVKRLRPGLHYDLVLANLFSGILGEAAPQIADRVAPGGQLWLSGILLSQQDEMIAAYRGQRLRLVRTVRRGKWLMLQWQKQARQRFSKNRSRVHTARATL